MASVTKNKDYDLNKSFVDQDGNNYSSEASSNLVMWMRTAHSGPKHLGPNTFNSSYTGSPSTFNDKIGRKTYPTVQLSDADNKDINAGASPLFSFSTLPSGGTATAGADLPFSISMWLKLVDPSPTWNYFFGKDGNSYEYTAYFNVTSNQIAFSVHDGAGSTNYLLTYGTPPANFTDRWMHMVFTYGGGTATASSAYAKEALQIYINGEKLVLTGYSSGTYVSMEPEHGEPLRFGAFVDGNHEHDGDMAEIAMWSKELSSQEIKAIYNVTKNGMYENISGFTSNPPRTQLVARDNRSGAYPVAKSYAQTGFKGTNTLKPYNDEQTVIFHDSFSRIRVRYEELPNDAQTLRVTETPHVRPYDLNRDFVCQFTDNTYDLKGFGSNLIGHWRFNGTSLASVPDLSPQGNALTQATASRVPISSILTPSTTLSSASANFAGDDFLDNANVTSAISSSTFSISVWFRLDRDSQDSVFVCLEPEYIEFYKDDTGALGAPGLGQLAFYWAAGGSGTSGGWVFDFIPETERWYHAVVTFDASSYSNNPRLYIDGTLVSTIQFIVPSSSRRALGTFRVGGQSAGSFMMNGNIASTSLFNRVLSSTEVSRVYQMGLRSRALYKSSGDLQGWWTLDKDVSSSGNVIDRSGNSRSGTFDNAGDRPSFSALTPALPISNASNTFDGAGNRANIGDFARWESVYGLPSSGKMTFSSWFRPLSEGEGNAGRIIDFFDDQILLATYTGGYIIFFVAYTGSNQWVRTSDAIFGDYSSPYENFVHVVVTYDRDKLAELPRVYVNGLEVSLTIISSPAGSMNPYERSAYIGDSYGDDKAFDGQIASVAAWNKILEPDEVYTLYNAQSGVFGRSTNFEFQQGVILQPGNTEVNLKNIPQSDVKRLRAQIKRRLSSKGATPSNNELNSLAKAQVAVDRLAKKVNEQKFSGTLRVTANASGNELEIKQCMTGSLGNTSVSYENVFGFGVSPILITESNKRFSRVDFAGDENTKVRAASINMFGGSNDLMNYSTGLSVDSYWTKHPEKNDLVDSPNITGSIEVSGESRKGVADYGLDFSMTPYEPFVENLVPVEDNDFFNTGVAGASIDGFKSPTKDKVAIVIDCNPLRETQFGFTSANRFPLDGTTSGRRGPHAMCYYNFETNVWEPIGMGLSNYNDLDTTASTGFPIFENFVDRSCIGFGRGLDLPIDGVSLSTRPTNTFGFPYHPKFHATGSQQLVMSKYIDRPFVLEKYEYHFSGSFQSGDYHENPAAMRRTPKGSDTFYGTPAAWRNSAVQRVSAGATDVGIRQALEHLKEFDAIIRFANHSTTSGAALSGLAPVSNDDRFMVNVPRSLGGSGSTIKIIYKSSLTGTPNSDEVWVKLETSVGDTSSNLNRAFDGQTDATKTKYGTAAGNTVHGVAGLEGLVGYPYGSYPTGSQDYGTISLGYSRYGLQTGISIIVRNPTAAEYTNSGRNSVNSMTSFFPTYNEDVGPYDMGATSVEKNILAPFVHRAAINTFFLLRQDNSARFQYEKLHRPFVANSTSTQTLVKSLDSDAPAIGPLTGSVPANIQLTPAGSLTRVTSNRELITYGQWVSYYEYTGSAEITYSDTNNQPAIFQTSTTTAASYDRISYGDYLANTPYTGSTIDITDGFHGIEDILQSGLGRELNVYDDGSSATNLVKWYANLQSGSQYLNTGLRYDAVINPTANNLFSVTSSFFSNPSPTGSYVMRGESKVCTLDSTASIGGVSWDVRPTFLATTEVPSSILNAWSGNRSGLPGNAGSRGLSFNTGGSAFSNGTVARSVDGLTLPGLLKANGPLQAVPDSIDQSSPYILNPSDQIILGWQLALPRDFSPYSGSTFNDDTSPIGPNMSLLPGKGKLILYGSFIRDNEEHLGSLQQNLDSVAIHQAIGNEPISDQFDVAPNSAYFGSMSEQVITGTMKPGDNGQGTPIPSTPRTIEPIFAARGVEVEYTGLYYMPAGSKTGWNEGRLRSSRKTNYGNVDVSFNSLWIHPQTITQMDFASFGAIQRSIKLESDEVFYDSTAGAAVEYHAADGKKAVIAQDTTYSFLPLVCAGSTWDPAIISSDFNKFSHPDYGMSNAFLDECANFAWQRGFPFENRYKDINRNRVLLGVSGSIDIDTVKQDPGNANTGASTRAITTAGKTRPIVANLIRAYKASESTFDSECIGIFILPRNRRYLNAHNLNNDGITPRQIEEYMNLTWFTFGDNIGGSREPISYRADVFYNSSAHASDSKYWATFMPRGFKYGLIHSLPQKTSAHFRRQRYGQFRDMLEQRQYTRVYDGDKLMTSPVQAKFRDRVSGLTVNPMDTVCQNVSPVMSSSLPYFDGISRNRSDNPDAANDLSVTIGLL